MMIEVRQQALTPREPPEYSDRALTVETMEVSLPTTQSTQSQRASRARLSEMPLPFSPARRSTTTATTGSSSASSAQLEDTIDRIVKRKPRVSKATAMGIASQSLSYENGSSQDVTAGQRRSTTTTAKATTYGERNV